MFKYIENKDRTFLFGAYRGEKSQLDWILGEKTQRYEKLYNIRFNKDLFSQRNGGTISKVLPDFILIYNTQNPQEGYHLFPCVNSSVKEQSEMEKLKYPNPNGSYIVYSLGEELIAEPLNISELIERTFSKDKKEIPFAPKLLKGQDIANVVDVSFKQPKVAECDQHTVLRFIDLFAGIVPCHAFSSAGKRQGFAIAC